MKSLYEQNKRNIDGEKDLIRHMFKTAINDSITNGEKKHIKFYRNQAIEWFKIINSRAIFSFQNVVETLFNDVDVDRLRNRILYLINSTRSSDKKNLKKAFEALDKILDEGVD